MKRYDVAVIGAGITGAFIARELSRYDLKVVVIEKGSDACSGTSRANSGVVHSALYNFPGSEKARLCLEGNSIYESVCSELGVPYRKCGKLIVAQEGGLPEAWKEGSCDGPLEDNDGPATDHPLEKLLARGREVGTPGLHLIDKAALNEMEPNIEGTAALVSPESAIVSPCATTIAAAESAVVNGVEFILNTSVTDVVSTEKVSEHLLKLTGGAELSARSVVNAAGHGAGIIAEKFGLDGFTIYPCRGEYLLMDKAVGHLISRMIYLIPPEEIDSLGVHLTPTIDGHILVGPTAEFIDIYDPSTTTPKIVEMLTVAQEILPDLEKRHVIRSFAGLRPKLVPAGCVTEYGDIDFEIKEFPENVHHLLGIESPGLTAAPVIARETVAKIVGYFEPDVKESMVPYTWYPSLADLGTDERQMAIEQDPNEGVVVCRCEGITKAEILRALDNPLDAKGLNGIKYRTRAMMGRCQSGYCTPKITDIMIDEGIRLEEIEMGTPGSYLFTGPVKGGGPE